jgi:hypothetical protein
MNPVASASRRTLQNAGRARLLPSRKESSGAPNSGRARSPNAPVHGGALGEVAPPCTPNGFSSRSSALRADAVEFEFVIDAAIAVLLHDAFFERLDRAAEIEVLDFSTLCAHEVVVMMAWDDELEMRRALMQPEPPHQPGDFEFRHEAVNGGLVEAVQSGCLGEFGQCGGPMTCGHVTEQAVQTPRTTEPAFPQLRDATLDKSLDFAGLRAQMAGGLTHS